MKKDISDISTYEVGDIIIEKDENEVKVLAVCGEAFLRSDRSNFKIAHAWFTAEEAKGHGWKFKEEDDTVEIKVEGKTKNISRESAKELGLIE